MALLRAQALAVGLQVFEVPFQSGEVARIQLQMRHQDAQPQALVQLLDRHPVQQAGQLADIAARQQFLGAGLDDPGGRLGVAGQHRVADRLVDMPVGVEPVAGHGMQVARFRALLHQPGAQHLAQQGMQAIPGFAVVALHGGDEEVVGIQPGQAVDDARHVPRRAEQAGAERGAEAVADGGAGQQAQVLAFQARQHLALEVAGEGTGVAYLHRHERPALAGLEVEGEELQAGDPAIRQFMQPFRGVPVDAAELLAEIAIGLLQAEAQVAQVELAELALGPQARQGHRQRHRQARTEHQVQLRRGVFQQPLQYLQDARLLQVLQVVDHQHHVAGRTALGDTLRQGDDPVLDGQLVAVAAEQDAGVAHHAGIHLGEAHQQAVGEARQLVVLGGQRQPGHVEIELQQLAAPGQQGAGLAGPRRPLDHHAALPARLQQARHELLARNQAAGAAWRHHLGVGDGLNEVLAGRVGSPSGLGKLGHARVLDLCWQPVYGLYQGKPIPLMYQPKPIKYFRALLEPGAARRPDAHAR
ncbi:hypothetical protein D9M71_121130 [compost metagenome]